MSNVAETTQIRWSSRLSFLFASVGSAIGLANLWRFPYSVGANGGSAFVFVFLAAVLLLSTPLLIAEFVVGRRGRGSPPKAIVAVAREAGASDRWKILGIVGCFAAIIVLSFYSVVGGWIIAYFSDAFRGVAYTDPESVGARFEAINSSPFGLLAWFGIFLGITVTISAFGVRAGIESVVKLFMPLLFVLLVGLAAYALIVGDAKQALTYLFQPDFSKITPQVVMDAFGQAFFSLGVGATNMMAYGAYIERNTSIPRSSLGIAAADTTIALIAGVAIFPIVFMAGVAPDSGPGLVFQTLPIAFGAMPAGELVSGLFFLLLFFAAITSSISMMEAPVSWLRETFSIPRYIAAILSGLLSFALGILSVLSFNVLSGVHPLDGLGVFGGRTFFELFDFLATNIIYPGAAIFIAVFVGWVLPKSLTRSEFGGPKSHIWHSLWKNSLRFVIPVVLLVILIQGVFGLSF